MKTYQETNDAQILALWEDVVLHGKDFNDQEAVLDPVIRESWEKSIALGIDPLEMSDTEISEELFQSALAENKELIDVAFPYMEGIYRYVSRTNHILQLCSKEGYVLKAIADDRLVQGLSIQYLSMKLAGFDSSESCTGTNSSGMCLRLNQPVQIIGAEHFQKRNHVFSCSSAPIQDEHGEVIGCLTLMCPKEYHQGYSLGVICTAADGIRKELQLRTANHRLSLSNQTLNTTLNLQKNGVFLLDDEKRILFTNTLAPSILGLDKKPLEGTCFFDLIEQDSLPESLRNLDHSVSSRLITVRNCHGQQLDITMQATLSSDPDSRAVSIIVGSKDNAFKLINSGTGAAATYTFDSIIGTSQAIQRMKAQGLKAAHSNSTVLLLGESGTGKELLAHAIHNASDRVSGPFIALNCGSLPKDLIASELFGYEGGSFTGAKKAGNPGKFELADGGTIFLDEIGDMPLNLQVMLLRVLQDKEVTRVGGNTPKPIDVRVIAATHRNLRLAITDGSFREDLYYRLNVLNIYLPPLRIRKGDIRSLCSHFLSIYSDSLNKTVQGIDDNALQILMAYSWPGNVRELENTIEQAVNFAEGTEITPEDLPRLISRSYVPSFEYSEPMLPPDNMQVLPAAEVPEQYVPTPSRAQVSREQAELIALLKAEKGNVKRIAARLNMPVSTVYNKLNRYGLRAKDYKALF